MYCNRFVPECKAIFWIFFLKEVESGLEKISKIYKNFFDFR